MKIDKKNRKRKKLTALAVGVILVYILLICPGIRFRRQKSSVIEVSKDAAERNTEEKPEDKKEETLAHKFQDVINQAERLFLSYDYDGALDLIQGIEGFEDDRELKGKADFYQKEKESCEPVNIQEVTHVFYHSLVVDPERAFANQERDPQAVGNNQWMTTISEFKKILQEMYDRGYVIVGIHDMVREREDEEGNILFEPGEIMLPKGKKAYVLSQDDLSYYHCYDNYLNINGNLNDDKRQWLIDNPDFDIEKEREQAKKVADALKEEGWEFASHTWGHIKIGDVTLSRLIRDTQKWRENVEPLVGGTDVIVFAHGQDLGDWGNYNEYDEKYQFLKGEGYHIFCNVDQGQYRVHFGRDYLRQGRRDLDGYRIYRNAAGKEDSVSDLFDAKEVIDSLRPPVPPLR
ncbi:MAG: hypothetical protein OSJ44_04435 [Lachnospiraceae bacterium]|nr:hypothetical protein [Lachnospiraceae bacterium]